MKRCTECGEEKPLDAFRRDARRRDGRGSRCKACARSRARRYYEENREAERERGRRYYEENREAERERRRRYREENREAERERGRRRYEENREAERERRRRYYEENREAVRERGRRYYEENREDLSRDSSARVRGYQERTAARATVTGPWSPAEDAYLLRTWYDRIIEQAYALGRTYESVAGRRRSLRESPRV